MCPVYAEIRNLEKENWHQVYICKKRISRHQNPGRFISDCYMHKLYAWSFFVVIEYISWFKCKLKSQSSSVQARDNPKYQYKLID